MINAHYLYLEAYLLSSARAATRQQLIIDMYDVSIPATGAGIFTINEGTLGILGYVYTLIRSENNLIPSSSLISSILGAKAQWIAVNGKR